MTSPQYMHTSHFTYDRRIPEPLCAHHDARRDVLVVRKGMQTTYELSNLTALCPCRLHQPRDEPTDSERTGPRGARDRALRRIDGSTMNLLFGLTTFNCGSLRSSDGKPACPAVILTLFMLPKITSW
jgi:hypothetical protein